MHNLQGFNPFFPYGGFAPPPPMLQQALMQQQAAAAAMFGSMQPGAPGSSSGQQEHMVVPPGMDPAMAVRSMQYAQAMAANAAMMGFQVSFRAAMHRNSRIKTRWLRMTAVMAVVCGAAVRHTWLRCIMRWLRVSAVKTVKEAWRTASSTEAHSAVMQNGGGMPYGLGGPFPGVGQPMPYGQAGFSGPPSPGNMSAVGSIAKEAEHAQRNGSPRPQSPSVDSVEGSEGRDQCTHGTQMQQEQDDWHRHAAGGLSFRHMHCKPAVHHPQGGRVSEGQLS